MLSASELTIRIDDWVGVYDLAVPKGRLAALVGPSGGGKSTLLNAIAGFERVESGACPSMAATSSPWSPHRRPVAIVFQEHNLLPHLDAADNAGLALSPSLRLTKEDRARRSGARAGGPRQASALAGPPSCRAGQRQRVALARAVLTTQAVAPPRRAARRGSTRRCASRWSRSSTTLRRETGLTVADDDAHARTMSQAGRTCVLTVAGRVRQGLSKQRELQSAGRSLAGGESIGPSRDEGPSRLLPSLARELCRRRSRQRHPGPRASRPYGRASRPLRGRLRPRDEPAGVARLPRSRQERDTRRRAPRPAGARAGRRGVWPASC